MAELPLKNQFISETTEFMKGIAHKNCIVSFPEFRQMIDWHMGWIEDSQTAIIEGKRLRPLLLLLFCNLTGGTWKAAIPAAAAVELIHNFTLVHDDIQDNSPTRHGRETLWVKYGIPQAINIGDSLFSMAELCLAELEPIIQSKRILEIYQVINQTVLNLTKGQFLDLLFEKAQSISLDSYLEMINWKTAELIRACTQIGTILGSNSLQDIQNAKEFGSNVGISFQIQDDYLGIWGESKITGKPTQNDLISRKKTLPIIYGLQNKGEFFKLWNTNENSPSTINELMTLLELEGAREYTKDKALLYSKIAENDLSYFSEKDNLSYRVLCSLTDQITNRNL
ncbi:MAG: polyprenyl synthetase family protein [Anaerolineaceae bacterium]|nr:polyprenyl synthetase family protein [Anaerolineaceae bacterium]